VTSHVDASEAQYVVPALTARNTQAASGVTADVSLGKALFDQVRSAQSKLGQAIGSATNADFADAANIRAGIVAGVVARAIIGVGLGIRLLLLALRAILRPLTSLRELARAMKEGRQTGSTPPPAPPELAEVYEAIVAAGIAIQQREVALARANEDLGEASRLKSDFLATMSHELRTPLNAILGFTDLVRSGATGPIAAETDDYLERVRRNGSVLLELINDVLDVSKIEAGRMVMSHDVVDVEPIVREVFANLQGLAADKNVGLELHSNGDDLLAVADRRALKQIVTNLLSNAVKFTVEGAVSVTIRVQAGATFIDVRDTGPGIGPEDREAIFEPFRQVGAHARTGTGGTGLGLAISVRLARLMGGDIVLESQPGNGSCFTLRLPAVQDYASATDTGDTPVILGVDDDLDALSLWQAQCERMGFKFIGVRQSSAAITAAARLRPAAILLDIVFPESSGWDVLELLRADSRTADTPVHVISVTDGEEQASIAGVRFLQKPVSEDRLCAELMPYQRQPAKTVAAVA
jgi:signal transduction histidine kinase/ActR/RegA family two-component response regulator